MVTLLYTNMFNLEVEKFPKNNNSTEQYGQRFFLNGTLGVLT